MVISPCAAGPAHGEATIKTLFRWSLHHVPSALHTAKWGRQPLVKLPLPCAIWCGTRRSSTFFHVLQDMAHDKCLKFRHVPFVGHTTTPSVTAPLLASSSVTYFMLSCAGKTHGKIFRRVPDRWSTAKIASPPGLVVVRRSPCVTHDELFAVCILSFAVFLRHMATFWIRGVPDTWNPPILMSETSRWSTSIKAINLL